MFRIAYTGYLADIIVYNLAIREEKFSKKKDFNDTRQWMQLETIELDINGFIEPSIKHSLYLDTYVVFRDKNIERRLKFSIWDFAYKSLYIHKS